MLDAITGQFGKCSRCMRTSFVSASGAWIVAIVVSALLPPAFAIAAWIAAAALTALWLVHVWMFTRRSVSATAVRATGGTVAEQHAALWPRRRVLAAFVRTLIFSAMIAFTPRNARAEDCNCFNDNDCYCPPDFPQCIFNPTTGEAICCGPNTTGCAGPTQTWCCPPGTNCYGNDGQCYGGH